MFSKIMFYTVSFVLFFGTGGAVMMKITDSPSKAEVASREPSSIQRVYDYSDLKGNALAMAAKDRLVNSINIKNKNDELSIAMGNFVLLNDDKEKDFACGYYDRLSFVFEASGVIVEGERPTLTVDSSCELGANINEMVPVKISLNSLKNQKPSDTEYKFFADGRAVSVTVNHSPSAWPTEWILKNVKLTHSKISSRFIQVPTFEVGMGRRHQIIMEF